MLLIIQHLKSYSISFSSVIAQLDFDVSSVERLGNPEKELDYPVKSDADLREESLRPDNDNHWNRVRYE
jgi:hypothetical protein